MKKQLLIQVGFVLSLTLGGCQNKQKSAAQQQDSSAIATSGSEKTTPVPATGRLAELGLTGDSHWRGINLGDEFSTVKSKEKGEPFESDAKHIGYTVEFPNLESADMLYYQTNQKVSAIDVDLFLNSRQSVDAFQQELTPYFTARYGVAKPGNGGSVWTGPKGETVTLKDVSKGKDFGLKIKIASASNETTASAR